MQQSKSKNKKSKLKFAFLVISICIIFGLTGSLSLSAETDFTSEKIDMQIVKIKKAKDLLRLAENCSLDSWSVDKKVVLEADIDLTGTKFEPIPVFGGIFDGQGHTVSGLEMTASVAPAGLFGKLQEDAVVKNVNVVGHVTPAGDGNNVGGIVGENYGQIINCTFTGTVTGLNSIGGIAGFNSYTATVLNCRTEGSVLGENRTGGIVGYNQGTVEKCKNGASVNCVSVDPIISTDNLKLGAVVDMTQLNSLEITNVADDVGGVAGYSTGMILGCRNNGTVGYPHIGYNVGGIAGRSCGFVHQCHNEGAVFGRNDVGGIIGQMEPYIQVTLTESGIARIKRELDALNDLLDAAEGHLDSSMYEAEQAVEETREYLEQIEKIMEEDSADAYIQNMQLTEMMVKVQLMAAKMEALGAEMVKDAGVLGRDLNKISRQSVKLSETLEIVEEELENAELSDYIADTSYINIEEMTYGKVAENESLGAVYGDYNVGGIAGFVALDDELDPEDDVIIQISLEESRQYELKALLYKCINRAAVTAKKDNVGGICGRIDIGLTAECQSYGSVVSENGDCVGGIAGTNSSILKDCFAKCSLSGYKYIGGIVGLGVAEDATGESSLVSGCYAIADILNYQQFAGAIAGAEGGEYLNNFFVSEELRGIDRVSYEGKAEQISYKKLLGVKGLPEEFKSFTLTFMNGTEVVYATEFQYGDSFKNDIFPVIVGEDGNAVHWDRENLKNLKKDTVVRAVQGQYLTTLASEQLREDNRSVFLAEGRFGAEAELKVSEKEISFTPQEKEWSSVFYQAEVKEQWKLKMPEDGQLIHSVRFLPDEEYHGEIEIYVRQDGKWKQADWTQKGSYLQFYIAGTEGEIAVVTMEGLWKIWIVTAVVICLVIIGGIWMIRKKKNIWRWLIYIVSVFILIAAVLLVLALVKGKLRNSMEAYQILKAYAEQPEQAMHLTLEANLGEDKLDVEADVFCTEFKGKSVTCIRQSGISLFYSEGILYLDNGKAFQASEVSADYREMLEYVVLLYDYVDVEEAKEGEDSIYTISVKEENTAELTEYLLPAMKEAKVSAEQLQVTLQTSKGALAKLTFGGSGSFREASEKADNVKPVKEATDFAVKAVLEIENIKDCKTEIPEAVQQAILSEDTKIEDMMSGDVFRLYAAWRNLYARDPLGIKIGLQADCGPLSLEEEITLISTVEEDTRINCLQKEDFKLYFTEDTVCSEKGYAVTSSKAESIRVADLLAIAYELCLNGTFNSVEADDIYIYSLSLDEEAMQEIAKAITAESAGKGIRFENGSIRIFVKDEKAESIFFSCDGTMDVLLAKISVAFSAELDVTDEEQYEGFVVPEKVQEALVKE